MRLNLTKAQQKIVQYGEGALLVEAGPGSGKTRVLTERIRRLLTEVGEHFSILALTFTNKAANEMKDRLLHVPGINERSFIGTFHSFCAEVLRRRGRAVGIEHLPCVFESITDRKRVMLESVMGHPQLSHVINDLSNEEGKKALLRRWFDAIEDAKASLRMPEEVQDERLALAYEAYNAGLRASGAVDFGDLLLFTYRLFLERPKIAGFYRRQYRYICIDEAQDINQAQYQVLTALCADRYRNVMMVGDPKQAIFVWNGADPKYLRQFEKDFGAARMSLDQNFRSSRAVVSAARALLPEYSVEGRLALGGDIRLIVGRDEREEASRVIDYVQNVIDHGHPDIEGPVSLRQCALISRTRYALSSAEDELNSRGLQYYKHVSAQHESESDLFRDFEACLRIKANPLDKLHLREIARRWGIKGLPAPSPEGVTDRAASIFSTIAKAATTRSKEAVVEAIETLGADGESPRFIQAILRLESRAMEVKREDERAQILQDAGVWRKHWDFYVRSEVGGRHSLRGFLSQVTLGATQQPSQDGLALLTVHSAKGLEFDLVVIMGMAEGVFPDYRARGRALEEEKRNAFVAVTRSRRLLAFSYPKSRLMPWAEQRTQSPSRYLSQIGLVSNTKGHTVGAKNESDNT